MLDASVTFPWLFEDEASAAADALLDHVTEHGAVVPALWFLECTNGLASAERRGRIDDAGIAEAIRLLRRLPLVVDEAAPARAFDAVLDLARAHGLTTYDAGYLDLALRRGLPLATNDGPLRKAANTTGVALLAIAP